MENPWIKIWINRPKQLVEEFERLNILERRLIQNVIFLFEYFMAFLQSARLDIHRKSMFFRAFFFHFFLKYFSLKTN